MVSTAVAPVNELPLLPTAPRIELRKPTRVELDDLESRLVGLLSTDSDRREEALEQLLEFDASLLPAIGARLELLATKLDRERFKRQLQQKGVSSKGAAPTGGLPLARDPFAERLARWLDERSPSEAGFAEGAELLALCRMLTRLGSVEAARELIALYARMGEFLRIDIQRALTQLGDSGTAALIEARRHRAQKIADWAERQLDQSGKSLPSAAIRTDNTQGLADILRALGRTRDPDAARIIISFANSERHQIRVAARQSIALLGEVALWQLREAYENTVGKRPPRDWSAERIARELFSEHDRVRLARVERTFREGLALQARGDHAAMARSFDAVLLRAPNYERGSEMASGYLAWGEQLIDREPDAALLALGRAERLATDAPTRERARSLRITLMARNSLKEGAVDTELMRTAAALDLNNQHVRRDLARLESEPLERDRARLRAVAAGAIGLLSLLGILVVLLRGRASHRAAASPDLSLSSNRTQSTTPTDPSGAPDAQSPTDLAQSPISAPSSTAAPHPEPASDHGTSPHSKQRHPLDL